MVEFGPCISAATAKACALIGLQMMEKMPFGRTGDSSPDPGKLWECGCPKSPVWSGDGFELERSEDTSSVEYHEYNVDNLAFEVVGQNWSS